MLSTYIHTNIHGINQQIFVGTYVYIHILIHIFYAAEVPPRHAKECVKLLVDAMLNAANPGLASEAAARRRRRAEPLGFG